MNTSANAKIHFCFPDSPQVKTQKVFVNSLVHDIRSNKESGYAGFALKKYLHSSLSDKFGKDNFKDYKPLSAEVKSALEKEIKATFEKCHDLLSAKSTPIDIFVFPWFPGKGDSAFEGVNGFTPYANVFHLYVAIDTYSTESLRETVAHELTHAVLFRQYSKAQTLLESIVSEGIAENFREEIVGGPSAPWSLSLSEKESRKIFTLLESLLEKTGLYEEVFWGSKKYKKWAGYSIGYRLLKSFRKENPKVTWKEILSMDAHEVLDRSHSPQKKRV